MGGKRWAGLPRSWHPLVRRVHALHRSLAVALAIFWGFFFYGLIDLLAFAQGPDFHQNLLLSTGWGLLFLFLVAAPLFAVATRPAAVTPAALGLVAAAALAVTAGAAASGSAKHLVVAAGLAATAAVVAWSGGGSRSAWPWDWRPAALPISLVVLAVPPGLAYWWDSARATNTNLATDVTAGLDHWPIQAALPIALILGATVAAGHPQGWRLPSWCVGSATAWLAVLSFLEPGLPGSLGQAWAAITLLWAVCFLAAVQCSGLHARPSRRRNGRRPSSPTSKS